MPDHLSNVVIDTQLLPGFERDGVIAQLQQQLKLSEARAQQLLAADSVTVVKRNVPQAVAEAYCKRLRALGIDARHFAATNAAEAQPAVSIATAMSTAPDYFQQILAEPGNSRAYRRALLAAVLYGLLHIGCYGALTLLIFAFTLYFLLDFGYLLTAPPILFSALVFLLPAAALAFISALLLRPFLPAPPASDDSVELSRATEPGLHTFIDQLCAVLALPPPASIAVDTRAHIAITPLPGAKHFSRGDYALVLGLPLLDACHTRQFAGTVAATLRTRALRSAMLYLTMFDAWCSRAECCTAQSDCLKLHIDTLQKHTPYLHPLWKVVNAGFRISERLLQRQMQSLHKTHARFLRALIPEHDRYLALIAGTAAVQEHLLIEAGLSSASADALAKNLDPNSEGASVDNLPALIRHYYENLGDKFVTVKLRHWRDETTPRPTEPAIARDRIETAIEASSLIEDDRCASTLLANFTQTAIIATRQHYRARGIADTAPLIAVDDLAYAASQDILQKEQAAVYFNSWFASFRFWSLADYQLVRHMPLQDAAQQLSVCISEIRRLSPDRFRLLADYERLQNQLLEILVAQHVLGAGKPFAFRYIHYDGNSLQPALEERQQQLAAAMQKLAQQEAVMGGRITLGLRLSGQDEADVVALHDTLRLLHETGTRLYKLALDTHQLEHLLQRQALREANYSLPIARLMEKIGDASNLILARLTDIPNPLDTRRRSLKECVEAALTGTAPGAAAIAQRARRLLATLYTLNEKLSLQAADYGTIAEEAYRIEPIRLLAPAE